MSRTRSLVLLVGLAAVALALAACGTSSGSSNTNSTNGATSPSGSTAGGSSTPGQATTVDVANSGLGQIVVDSAGRTLYLFQADSGTTSNCSGACASAWPPLRVTGPPASAPGLNASLVGTTPRSDGDPQVTYNGHPLYTYEGDLKAGDTTGQGLTAFGGGWFAISPAGTQISAGATSGSTPTSGSGYGY